MVKLQRHAASGFGVERAGRLCHESAQLQQCWEQVNHGDPYTEGQPEGLKKQTKQQFSLGLGVLLVHFCVCVCICACTLTCTSMWRLQKDIKSLPWSSPHYILKQGLSIKLRCPQIATSLGCQSAPEIWYLSSRLWKSLMVATMPTSSYWILELQTMVLQLAVWVASPLTTKGYPSLWSVVLLDYWLLSYYVMKLIREN